MHNIRWRYTAYGDGAQHTVTIYTAYGDGIHSTRWRYTTYDDGTQHTVTIHSIRWRYMYGSIRWRYTAYCDATQHMVTVHNIRWRYTTYGDEQSLLQFLRDRCPSLVAPLCSNDRPCADVSGAVLSWSGQHSPRQCIDELMNITCDFLLKIATVTSL